MNIFSLDTPVYNQLVSCWETLHLPEIVFFSEHDKSYISPDSPGQSGLHIHDQYEAYVHVSGVGAFLVNNSTYPLHRGDVILTRPGDVHVRILQEPGIAEYFCLWLAPGCGDVLLNFMEDSGFCNHLCFTEETSEELLELFYRLTAANDGQSDLERLSVILRILLIFSQKKAVASYTVAPVPEEMQGILDYVNAEFREIGSIGELAARFHISTATLNRWFRRYLHISPQEFLKAKRLSYAKQCLDRGDSVTASCMQAGFSDCSYFIAVFRRAFGMTPYHYQHSKREQRRK